MTINQVTTEECSEAIIQLGSRIDYFDKEMAESKDPARIREMVRFAAPLISFRDKLIIALKND